MLSPGIILTTKRKVLGNISKILLMPDTAEFYPMSYMKILARVDWPYPPHNSNEIGTIIVK